MKLEANPDLLINQWRSSPKFYSIIKDTIDVWNADVVAELVKLEKMWHVDTATGAWLDLIGIKLGIERPSIIGQSADKKFGFKSVDKARSFDQEEYKGALSNETRYPLADDLFRKIIKARGITVVSNGSFLGFNRAVKEIDPKAHCTDNRDMSVTIQSDEEAMIVMADGLGAIPRPVGVNIIYRPGRRWGFDDAGAGFDQAEYE